MFLPLLAPSASSAGNRTLAEMSETDDALHIFSLEQRFELPIRPFYDMLAKILYFSLNRFTPQNCST